jgi:hypothetical protein
VVTITQNTDYVMGNGFSSRKRYINGKFPEKCWIDDVWPEVDDMFDKLNFDQKSGYEVFKVYARMDSAEQNQLVDINQVYSYYGGRRNKYNERIFYALHDDKAESPTKLSFVNFGILIWNYCTLRPSDLARHIFEIYDVDITGQLERPDLESIYKMMYDCDDHDEHCISQFPFDKDGVTKKWEFIDHCNRKRHLIKPATDYQRRLRHRTGGLLMWEALTRYRVRTFAVHDSQVGKFTLSEKLLLMSR